MMPRVRSWGPRFRFADNAPLFALAAVAIVLVALWLLPTGVGRHRTVRRRPAASTSSNLQLPIVAVDARPEEVGGVIRSVVPVDGGGPVVALSFDDGPDPVWTPQVLDILHGFAIRATFCLVGRSARAHPDLVRRIRDPGHVLCDHSQTHPLHLDRRPEQDVQREVVDAEVAIAASAGVTPSYFRPPGGAFAPIITEVSHHNGMRVLGWSIDPRDWKAASPDDVVGYIEAGIRPGAIVLLHDGGGNRAATVAALSPLIHALANRGYRFATP